MLNKSEKVKIQYECNSCGKTRVLHIATKLHVNVAETGYVEYVDVHTCKEDKLSANIICVDKHLSVRSQEQVNVGNELTAQKVDQHLNIPMPKRVDLTEEKIQKNDSFKGKNIKKLIFRDKLRQTKFILEGKETDNSIFVVSEFKFIEVQVWLHKRIDETIAQNWFIQIASILEAIILLDEEMLSYLITYLDNKIESNLDSNSIFILDLLIHAKSIFPKTNLRLYAIFKRNWNTLKGGLPREDFHYYERILTSIMNNEHKTLLDVYEVYNDRDKIDFGQYISSIYELSLVGIANIERMEFITIDTKEYSARFEV